MVIQAILSAIMVVYILLLGFLTALFARKHHWVIALIRTGVIIVSVVISVPISQAIAGALGGLISPLFEGILGGVLGDFGDLMTHIPVLEQSLHLAMSLMIVPVIFGVVFLVLRAILSLVVRIVSKFVPFFKKKGLKNTAIAIPVGALNGVLIAMVTLVPLCGYFMMVSSFTSMMGLSAEEQAPTQEVVAYMPSYEVLEQTQEAQTEGEELVDGMASLNNMANSPLIKVVNTLGMPLFDWMTTGTVEGGAGDVSFSLRKDIPHLTNSLGELSDAMTLIQDQNVTDEDKQALTDAVDNMLSSDWVAEVMAQAISHMATQWKNGESFMGQEAPDMGEMMKPIMDKTWEILSTENGANLRQDLGTVTNVLADLMSLGFLGDGADKEQLMSQLGKDSALSHMLQELGDNPHMAVLADEIRALGVRLASSVMGDALLNSDQYDGMMENIATSLNDVLDVPAEERKAVVQTAVKDAFAEHEIDIPEDVAVEMSEKAIADLGEDGEITGDELKNYFVEHMDEGMGAIGDIGDIDLPEGM